MRITGQVLVLDAADLEPESAFWAALLGGTVAARQDWHSVIVDGAVAIGVQHAPDHRPPAWPDGGAQQVHLDLYVEDVTAAHAHATAAGAELVQVGDGSDERGGFHVYVDPAGHPFCLCWGPPPLGQVAARHLASPVAGQDPATDVVRLAVVDPAEQRARSVVRAAMDDIASRYYARPATPAEVDAALDDEPGDDLVAPTGLLVVAAGPDGAVGCAGLRLLPERVGEIKKVYVAPTARGTGLGRRLVEEVERLAALHGCATVRLDTRSDLVEARRLYARLGYAEVAPFNAGPYAEHWLAKDLPAQAHREPC